MVTECQKASKFVHGLTSYALYYAGYAWGLKRLVQLPLGLQERDQVDH